MFRQYFPTLSNKQTTDLPEWCTDSLTKYPTGPHRTPPGHTGPNRTPPAQLSTETVRQKTYPKPAAYTDELELKYYL